MNIKQEKTEAGGGFYVEKDGKRLGEMTYRLDGSSMTITPTAVDESLQGRGVGRDLVARGVAFARENDLRVVPTCSYAKKVIDETEEYQDVLA